MQHNKRAQLYDLLQELREELDQKLAQSPYPSADLTHYRTIIALAAAYTLQDHVAACLAEDQARTHAGDPSPIIADPVPDPEH